MQKITVSFVVPAYNAEQTLTETLDSLLAQTFEDYEIIIVDDGSTDSTFELAQDYAKKSTKIRVISQENRGTAGAYNTGVASARGEWICICSADDILYPKLLATFLTISEQHAQYDIFTAKGHYWVGGKWKRPVLNIGKNTASWEMSLEEVIRNCFFGVGALYRRNLFDLVGGYRTGIYGEDYDFWLRCMAKGARVCYVLKILSAQRISTNQKTGDLRKVFLSNISILENLIACGDLGSHEANVAQETIEATRAVISNLKENATYSDRLKQPAGSIIRDLAISIFGRDRVERIIVTLKGQNK